MEIRDYLRAIRRILWLVIAIPIVAGLLVGGFIELQPSSYQADASVVVPAITANGISQSAASQYASTFKDVLTSQQVIPDVSQKFNIPQAELVAGLTSSTTTASSNLINVVLTGKKGQNLAGAVREATIDTLDAIAGPLLVQAGNEVTNAQTLLSNANTNIANFDQQYGNASPQVSYNFEQGVLTNWEQQLQTALLGGDAKRVTALRGLITTTQTTLAKLGTALQQYQPLANAQSAAIAAMDKAESDLVSAQSLGKTDRDPATVVTKDVGRLSKLSDTIKFAAIAFALALLMMLGLILILELMRGGKRAQPTVDAGQQGAFAWAPPAAQTRPAGPPATPAMAGTPAATRDPWRATDSSSAVVDGNGNGNGHDIGDAPMSVPAPEADPQRAGLFRRR